MISEGKYQKGVRYCGKRLFSEFNKLSFDILYG